MKQHEIELKDFLPHGQVVLKQDDSKLFMTSTCAIPSQRFEAKHLSINSYIFLPDKYKLPLKIELIVKIDAPGFYILFGKGHLNFATFWSDNRRIDDIVEPTYKTAFFDNHMTMNVYTKITLLYDLKEMQILIDGEQRYYSKKEKYMKSSELQAMNQEGFSFKIACDKLSNLCIKSVNITEYEDSCKIIPMTKETPADVKNQKENSAKEKWTFEKSISFLSKEIQSEILKMDTYLKALKEVKFKRQIDKNGTKITYLASEYGFSYVIYLSKDVFDHSLQWYLITNGKPETWHRKADWMEELLQRIQKNEPDFAQQMFSNLEECVGCRELCLARTKYQMGMQTKVTCHGKLKFKMSRKGFEDAKKIIQEIAFLVQEKAVYC